MKTTPAPASPVRAWIHRGKSAILFAALALAAGVLVARFASGQAPPASAAPFSGGAPPTGEGEPSEEPTAPASGVAPTEPLPSARAGRLLAPLKDGMLRLPGGKFTMGTADLAAPPNERPPHTATVGPFWIDRSEVTVGDYRACVEKRACAPPAKSSATCTYDLGDPALPVSCVRWRDADDYCRANGKRLPHETEWEYAARGTWHYRFPWGGSATSCAYAATLITDATGRSCTGKRPTRVLTHPLGASPFGVQDLSGNVEEWTADWYAPEGQGSAPRAGASHVLRGGGWLSAPSMSRTTSRNWGSVLEAGANIGFRCARD